MSRLLAISSLSLPWPFGRLLMQAHEILPTLFAGPTRREAVRLGFKMTASQTNQHFHELQTILGQGRVPAIVAGDTLTFDYRFGVDYFGRVEECLKAILTIVDDKTVELEGCSSEFNYGESLILRIGAVLRDLQIAMENRQHKPKSLWRRLLDRWMP